MITIDTKVSDMLNKPARRISARVEQYECSALQDDGYNRMLVNTFSNSGALKDFKVERVGEDGKFFGFGICQKLTVQLIDPDRAIDMRKDQVLEIAFGVDDDYTYPCPLFRIEEVTRNESNNDLTVVAYDFLYKAGEHRVSELELTSYTIRNFVHACASLLNLPVKFDVDEPAFDVEFPKGANFEGSETIREALNGVADATQTIYFIDWDWRLTFKRLEKDIDPVLHINRTQYFSLTNKTDRTLTTIYHTTESEIDGDLEATTGQEGVTQFVRNNPFWEARTDVDVAVNNALAAVAGLTISQFDCSWRGNFALEIGDKISITTKDNQILVAYVLNDTLTYNGGLSEHTFWTFTEHTAETAKNPITLGEAIRKTYAKVDKANQTISLYASETTSRFEEVLDEISKSEQSAKDYAEGYTDAELAAKAAEIKVTTDGISQQVVQVQKDLDTTNTNLSALELRADSITQQVTQVQKDLDTTNENVSTLEVRADGISADVTSMETTLGSELSSTNSTIEELKQSLNSSVEDINNSIVTLSTQVGAQMTDEHIQFQVKTALSNGVDSVSTTTGYTFDNEGLTIAKTGSEMTTQITEDGMTVYRGTEGVLIANNEGVHAEDLRATTYLIIGDRSRFENFERDGSIRTGCFWIG